MPTVTQQAARNLGLTGWEQHTTRQVSQALLEGFDLVIVMENGHKEALCFEFPRLARRICLLSEIGAGISYDIPDPKNRAIDPDEVAYEIDRLVTQGLGKIVALTQAQGDEK